jgi:hypothetical protein
MGFHPVAEVKNLRSSRLNITDTHISLNLLSTKIFDEKNPFIYLNICFHPAIYAWGNPEQRFLSSVCM